MGKRGRRYIVAVEDYNVPPTPWYILVDYIFPSTIHTILKGHYPLDSVLLYEKNHVEWVCDEIQFNALATRTGYLLTSDSKLAEVIKRKQFASFATITRLSMRLLREDLSKKTNRELFKLYEQFYKALADCWLYALIIQFADMGSIKYSDSVKALITPKLKKLGNPEAIFSKLITPQEKTDISKENVAVWTLIQKIQKNSKHLKVFKKSQNVDELPPALRRSLQALAQRYGWMQFYYQGPPADERYYFELIKRNVGRNANRYLQSMSRVDRDLIAFQRRAKKHFTASEQHDIETLKTFMYLKEARKEVQIYHFNYAMHRWFVEIGRRFNWSPLQAKYVILSEYKKLLIDNKKSISEKQLNERYAMSGYGYIGGKRLLISGAKARALHKKIVPSPQKLTVTTIRGAVAFAGKVSGTVRIINATQDMADFKDGDILVSIATNPSLVPAMNRAGGIITDTGGVTCHAAIVSRELKIPCIIGTSIATRALRNGDKVILDATNGIVRKQ